MRFFRKTLTAVGLALALAPAPADAVPASSAPAPFPIPWANSATSQYVRSIPEASQIGVQAGAASLTDGFPPLTFQSLSSGGVPPFGQDMNGILQQVTANLRWWNLGGPIYWSSSLSSAVGGYPKGAIVLSATYAGTEWINTVDNNTTDPDTGGAGWSALNVASFNGRTGGVNLTSGDVTGALTYTPLSTAGGTITGNLTVNGTLTFAGTSGFQAFKSGTDEYYQFASGKSLQYQGASGNVLINNNGHVAYYDQGGSFHADNFVGTLSGNASSATSLANSQTIALSGDIQCSAAFNGTAPSTLTNCNLPAILGNSGIVGSTWNQVPSISFDTKGRITGAVNNVIPTASTSGTGVTQLADATTAVTGTDATKALTSSSLATNCRPNLGWCVYPGGWLHEWGLSAQIGGQSSAVVTPPKICPNGNMGITLAATQGGTNNVSVTAWNAGTGTSFTIRNNMSVAQQVFWTLDCF